jgi:hypothetical protein
MEKTGNKVMDTDAMVEKGFESISRGKQKQ